MSRMGLFKTTVKVEPEWCVCVCVCVCARVCLSQLPLTFCDPIDYSLPEFSVYGIYQTRTLEQVTISYPRGSSLPRDQTCVSAPPTLAGRFITTGPPEKHTYYSLSNQKTEKMSQECLYPALLIQQNLSVAQKMHIIWMSSEQIPTSEQLINNCRTDSCSSWKSSLWLAGVMFHSLKKERAMPRVHLAGMRNGETEVNR